MLQDYLDVLAGPALLDRAGRVRVWGAIPPSVFRLGSGRADRLVVRDEVSGQERGCCTGEAMGTSRDEWVLGRVAPAGGDETVFARRPVTVGPYAGRLLQQALREDGSYH